MKYQALGGRVTEGWDWHVDQVNIMVWVPGSTLLSAVWSGKSQLWFAIPKIDWRVL